jgi:hypothetical protein
VRLDDCLIDGFRAAEVIRIDDQSPAHAMKCL